MEIFIVLFMRTNAKKTESGGERERERDVRAQRWIIFMLTLQIKQFIFIKENKEGKISRNKKKYNKQRMLAPFVQM